MGFIPRHNETGEMVELYDHGTTGRAKADMDPVAYDSSRRMSIDNPNFSIELPETWGFTDKSRLIMAVAVQAGRLYYSGAEGPQIWSVGLDPTGAFADDARLEIDLSGNASDNMITTIFFDGDGKV